jgi:YbbR domain-containing protein
MKPFFSSVWSSILDALLRLLGVFLSNFATKLVSFLIALVLWGVVLGSRNVEVTKEVALQVISSPDVVPANDLPEKVGFRLSGPKAFLRAILDRPDEPIKVNLTGTKPGMVTYRFFSDNIRVPIGVKVLSINPTAILIKLESVKTKEIPVHIEQRGSVAEGYQVTQIEVSPKTLLLKGAESKLESLPEAFIQSIELASSKNSIEKQVAFDAQKYGVFIDGPTPKVKVVIEQSLLKSRPDVK